MADPRSFIGTNIFLQGKALNVEQRAGDAALFATPGPPYTWMQLLAQVSGRSASSTESIVVQLVPQDRSVLKDDCYRVFAVVAGTQRVRRTLTGAEEDVPLVSGYAYERVAPGQFNVGCASP